MLEALMLRVHQAAKGKGWAVHYNVVDLTSYAEPSLGFVTIGGRLDTSVGSFTFDNDEVSKAIALLRAARALEAANLPS